VKPGLAACSTLSTPPLPLLVPPHVFDAFDWCASTTLSWWHPRGGIDVATPVDGTDPSRMVFVLRAEAPPGFLPRELARLHAYGLGFEDEEALAPYGIDDATDGLFERRLPPRDVLTLAADNLNALFWGLHDWAHFHNHGPLEEPAWTELQCDTAALAWIVRNQPAIGLDDARLATLHRELVALSARRFASEGKPFDPAWMALERVRDFGKLPVQGTSRPGGTGPSGVQT
jgi:hypothetical protein